MKRIHTFSRETKETNITGNLNIDGTGKYDIETGIGFLNHMLEQFSFHSKIDISLKCQGDLEICPHHSIEDIAITLGLALDKALKERKKIARYATFYLPMDECLTRTSIDISGRAYHIFHGDFSSPFVGEFPTQMLEHFFYSLAMNCKITLHQEILYGQNDHHKIESLFKGFAKTFQLASSIIKHSEEYNSTKGLL